MIPTCDYKIQGVRCGKPTLGEISCAHLVDGLCQEHLAEYLQQLFYPYNDNGNILKDIIEKAAKEVKDIVMV
jgi:hypothetical protein